VTKSGRNVLFAATGAATFASLTLAPPAMADDTGFYVGANVGRILSSYRRTDLDSALTHDFTQANSGFTFGTGAVERDRLMWSVDVGYMFSQNWGVEASYLHLGSLRYTSFGTEPSSDDTGTPLEVKANVEIVSHGPALALVGVLPMSNIWEVDARVGAYEGKTTSTYVAAVGDNTNPGKRSKSSTSTMVGVGTALTLTTHLIVRVDYLRIQHLDEQVFERSFNVDLVTAGLAYVF
jgi:opacity protein-like surface antigen